MIFEKMFPTAKHMEEVREGLIWSKAIGPCFVCGFPTHFIEINYQDYFCSSECLNKMDREAYK